MLHFKTTFTVNSEVLIVDKGSLSFICAMPTQVWATEDLNTLPFAPTTNTLTTGPPRPLNVFNDVICSLVLHSWL